MDTLSCDSGGSMITSSTSRLIPGHRLWASESGCHVLGLIEDYYALCEQIDQGQKLLAEMDIQIQETPSPADQELVIKVTGARSRRERGAHGSRVRKGRPRALGGGGARVLGKALGRGPRKHKH